MEARFEELQELVKSYFHSHKASSVFEIKTDIVLKDVSQSGKDELHLLNESKKEYENINLVFREKFLIGFDIKDKGLEFLCTKYFDHINENFDINIRTAHEIDKENIKADFYINNENENATSESLIYDLAAKHIIPAAGLRVLIDDNFKSDLETMFKNFSEKVKDFMEKNKVNSPREFRIKLNSYESNHLQFRQSLEKLGYIVSDCVDKDSKETFVSLYVGE